MEITDPIKNALRMHCDKTRLNKFYTSAEIKTLNDGWIEMALKNASEIPKTLDFFKEKWKQCAVEAQAQVKNATQRTTFPLIEACMNNASNNYQDINNFYNSEFGCNNVDLSGFFQHASARIKKEVPKSPGKVVHYSDKVVSSIVKHLSKNKSFMDGIRLTCNPDLVQPKDVIDRETLSAAVRSEDQYYATIQQAANYVSGTHCKNDDLVCLEEVLDLRKEIEHLNDHLTMTYEDCEFEVEQEMWDEGSVLDESADVELESRTVDCMNKYTEKEFPGLKPLYTARYFGCKTFDLYRFSEIIRGYFPS